MNFLNLMITCVGIVLGETVDVRAAEIVAGTHVDQTISFLQDLARVAADPNTDSAAAVKRTKSGENPNASRPARKPGTPPPAKLTTPSPAKAAASPPAKATTPSPAKATVSTSGAPASTALAAGDSSQPPASSAGGASHRLSGTELELAKHIMFEMSGDRDIMLAIGKAEQNQPGLLRRISGLAARVALTEGSS